MSNEESETESDVSGSGSTVDTGDESSTHSSDYDYETATDPSEEDTYDQPNGTNNANKKPPSNIEAQMNGANNTEQYAIDSDQDTGDSPSDEEEPEPLLKYQRLGLSNIIENDLISCVKSHPRCLVVGMKSGIVYVLERHRHRDIMKQYKPHSSAVTDISVDQSGDYVATCSQDGMCFNFELILINMFNVIRTRSDKGHLER